MAKTKVLLLALFAVFAFSAIAASAASATPEWLDLSGAKLTVAKEALTDGLWTLLHKFPTILGGGEIHVHCSGQLHGKVGPGSLDLVELVLGLVKPAEEKDLITCEVTQTSNKLCEPVGLLVLLHVGHLPWETKLLLLTGGLVVNDIFADGHGLPFYEVLCGSLKTSCEGEEESAFVKNLTGGSEFEFKKLKKTASCSDGGEGLLEGKGEVLDFFVSGT